MVHLSTVAQSPRPDTTQWRCRELQPLSDRVWLRLKTARTSLTSRLIVSYAPSIAAPWLALAVLLAPLTADAQEPSQSAWVEGHNSRVRFISGSGRAGVELVISKGWKTYWRMPGDAGVPPSFDWTGSVNVAKVDVLYPAPQRMVDKSGTAIGYKDRVIFPLAITPTNPAVPVSLALAMEYGVCKDICIPAEAKLALTLAPGNTSGHHGPRSPDLEQAIESVPRMGEALKPSDPRIIAITGRVSGATPKLTIDAKATGGIDATDLFIEGPDGTFVPYPSKVSLGGALVRFEVDLAKTPDAKDLVGKPLRFTLTGPTGATETTWVAQ
jgi:DsbC/DsbD-like thiol-disulfide interchange protein